MHTWNNTKLLILVKFPPFLKCDSALYLKDKLFHFQGSKPGPGLHMKVSLTVAYQMLLVEITLCIS